MYGKLRYDYLALLLLALCFSILLTRFYPPFEGMTEWIIMVIIFGSGVYPVYSLRKLQFSQDTPADARLLRMSTVCDKLFRGLGKTILGLLAVLVFIFIVISIIGFTVDFDTADKILNEYILIPLMHEHSILRLLIDVYGLRPKLLLIFIILFFTSARMLGVYLGGKAFKR